MFSEWSGKISSVKRPWFRVKFHFIWTFSNNNNNNNNNNDNNKSNNINNKKNNNNNYSNNHNKNKKNRNNNNNSKRCFLFHIIEGVTMYENGGYYLTKDIKQFLLILMNPLCSKCY